MQNLRVSLCKNSNKITLCVYVVAENDQLISFKQMLFSTGL